MDIRNINTIEHEQTFIETAVIWTHWWTEFIQLLLVGTDSLPIITEAFLSLLKCLVLSN